MGMAGTRFARNVALDQAFPEAMPGLMSRTRTRSAAP